jgi:hypothetical protein
MASQKDSISGIDIKADQITIAQYFPKENSVGSVIIKPLGAGDGRDFDTILKNEFKDLVAEIDFKNHNVALALPAEFSIVKKLSLDDNEKDVAQALRWELSQHLIGPIEEYVFDFEPLKGNLAAVRQYLVAAYRGDYVNKLVSLLKTNKLNPIIVGLDMFGLINVFEANYREQSTAPAALVLGTETASTIVVTQNGSLVDFDVFTHEAGPLAAEEYGARIAETMQRLYAGLPEKASIDAYVAGTLFSRADYLDSLVGKLGKAQMLDPFKSIACRAGKAEDEVRQFSHQLAVAVGMALQGGSEI